MGEIITCIPCTSRGERATTGSRVGVFWGIPRAWDGLLTRRSWDQNLNTVWDPYVGTEWRGMRGARRMGHLLLSDLGSISAMCVRLEARGPNPGRHLVLCGLRELAKNIVWLSYRSGWPWGAAGVFPVALLAVYISKFLDCKNEGKKSCFWFYMACQAL